MEQHKDNKIVFKQIEVEGDTVVATDKDNNVFYKLKFSNDIKGRIMIRIILIRLDILGCLRLFELFLQIHSQF